MPNIPLKSILLLLLIILSGCEKETLFPKTTPEHNTIALTPVDRIRNSFHLDNFNDPTETLKNNIQIQWEHHTTKIVSQTLWYEFDVTQTQKADIISEFQDNNQYKLLARLDEHTHPHYFIVKLAPQKGTTPQDFSYLYPQHFSGTVSLYDVHGEVAFLEYYKKGQVQHTVKDLSVKEGLTAPVSNKCVQKGTAMARCSDALSCAFSFAAGQSTGSCGSSGGGTGGYIPVRTDHYTDWYNVRGNGTKQYSHTQYNGSSYDYVYVSHSGSYGTTRQSSYSYYNHTGHGNYGNSQGYYSNTPPSDEMPERIILDKSFKTQPKVRCTYTQLTKNTTINELLKDFFGEDADFDLTFKVEDNLTCDDASDPSGCTKASYSYSDKKVVISIDNQYINSTETPTLFIARTLIHEAIHANLFLAVKKHNGGVTPTDSEFGILYEQYRKKKNWQHEFMADRYINLIANALKDVHPLLGDDTMINTYSNKSDYPNWNWDAFYTSIAWTGLLKNTTSGQIYLSDPENVEVLSLYYDSAKANATKIPNCN